MNRRGFVRRLVSALVVLPLALLGKTREARGEGGRQEGLFRHGSWMKEDRNPYRWARAEVHEPHPGCYCLELPCPPQGQMIRVAGHMRDVRGSRGGQYSTFRPNPGTEVMKIPMRFLGHAWYRWVRS